MRKSALVLGLVALCAATTAFAAPSSLSFSGRLTVGASRPVSGPISVTFAIHDVPAGGSSRWSDTLSVIADNGLVFAELGTASNPIDDTVFTGSKMFLEIIVEGETLSPRLSINSVPYAIRATSASSADMLGATISPSDVVTSVMPGAGLTGGGAGGDVSLSVDVGSIQSRVTQTCSPGSSIRGVGADGTVTCQAVVVSEGDAVVGNEITGASDASLNRAGAGTAASPFTLGVNAAVVQSRVVGTCSAGASIRTINQDGSVVCQTDTGISSEGDGVIGNEVTGPTNASLSRSGAGTTASPFTLGVNTSVIQNRVSGTCAVGSSIRAINQDGSVTCGTPGIAANTVVVVTSTSIPGRTVNSGGANCPNGTAAIGGGFFASDFNVFPVNSSPLLPGFNIILGQSGQFGPSPGWSVSVNNPNNTATTLSVAVICAP